MCGVAGIIDLVGQRPAPEGVVQRMARAITHRGPDEEGFLEQSGISLASRRLSIVDLADGQHPMARDSITCSPSPRCQGRGPVSKVFNSCHQDTACALRREVRARVRSLPNAPTGKWIFRRRVKRNGETIRMRW